LGRLPGTGAYSNPNCGSFRGLELRGERKEGWCQPGRLVHLGRHEPAVRGRGMAAVLGLSGPVAVAHVALATGHRRRVPVAAVERGHRRADDPKARRKHQEAPKHRHQPTSRRRRGQFPGWAVWEEPGLSSPGVALVRSARRRPLSVAFLDHQFPLNPIQLDLPAGRIEEGGRLDGCAPDDFGLGRPVPAAISVVGLVGPPLCPQDNIAVRVRLRQLMTSLPAA
jgi:hypothetical protein